MATSSGNNRLGMDEWDTCMSECDSEKDFLNRLQCHIVRDDSMLFQFQYLDVRFWELHTYT